MLGFWYQSRFAFGFAFWLCFASGGEGKAGKPCLNQAGSELTRRERSVAFPPGCPEAASEGRKSELHQGAKG